MVKKCNIISLGKINKNIFIVLLGGALYTGTTYVLKQSEFFGGEVNKYPVIFTLMHSLSLCLSFIFLIIYYIKNKKKNSKSIPTLIENNYKDRRDKDKAKLSWKRKLLWILLVAVLDFFCYLFSNFSGSSNEFYLGIMQINLIFMAIFSYLILKMKLYKHHYLCIFFILLKCVVYFIVFKVFKDFTEESIVPLVIGFITEISFCLVYILYKYYMQIKYMIPYEIMLFQGLIELLFSIITLIITTKCNFLDNFFVFISEVNGKEIAIIISMIILHFLYMIILYKTIEIFSPFYIFISVLLSEYTVFFVNIKELYPKQIIAGIILKVFCSFMILIFVEIIELNFWGLSTMTKKNIELRARIDSMITNDNDINQDINGDNDDEETFIDLKDYTFDVDTIEKNKTKSFSE